VTAAGWRSPEELSGEPNGLFGPDELAEAAGRTVLGELDETARSEALPTLEALAASGLPLMPDELETSARLLELDEIEEPDDAVVPAAPVAPVVPGEAVPPVAPVAPAAEQQVVPVALEVSPVGTVVELELAGVEESGDANEVVLAGAESGCAASGPASSSTRLPSCPTGFSISSPIRATPPLTSGTVQTMLDQPPRMRTLAGR